MKTATIKAPKIGATVTWTRKNGMVDTGKVKSKPETLANGEWVNVLPVTAPKGEKPARLRVSQLTVA